LIFQCIFLVTSGFSSGVTLGFTAATTVPARLFLQFVPLRSRFGVFRHARAAFWDLSSTRAPRFRARKRESDAEGFDAARRGA
jgi:hypothetical protein